MARAAESGEAAAYIADLTAELSRLAHRNGLHALSYLLDLAKMEAETVITEVKPRPETATEA
ncbi:MAG: hypothetical protein HXY30_06140 [Pseudorhodoplanes sp.]|nr:hypothetical protein [Pseudorhodoplanes sp.]